MSMQLVSVCLWILLAFVMAAFPSNDNHWRRAYILMAIGGPLLVWIIWTGHFWVAALFVTVACLVFRWPLLFLWRWMRRRVGV
jgi:succinate-acetate transporter protein